MDDYVIEVEDRSGKVSSRPLTRFPFSLGRGEENDLVLLDPSVSRHHASIVRTPEGLAIVDHRSRNGVFVNDERIVQRKILSAGDAVRIGSAHLRLLSPGDMKIPRTSKQTETLLFIPSKTSWDVKSSASLEPAQEAPPPSIGRSFRWMLQLFMDASLPEAYEHIVNMLEAAVSFDRCFLILFEDGMPERPRIVARRDYTGSSSQVFISMTVLNRVAVSQEAVLVNAEAPLIAQTESFIRSNASSAVCLPLLIGGSVIGVIYMDRLARPNAFVQGDIENLGPLVGVIALKIDNLHLLNARIALQLSKKDMALAKAIQEGFLPRKAIEAPGYSIEGSTVPCFEVGGDYFDFMIPTKEHLFLVIGDISGKGLPSSLYMAGIRSALHAHLEDNLDVAILMKRLEKHVQSTFRPDHFLTIFLGRIDLASGVLTYSNAGHLAPFLLKSDGELRELQITDPALNVIAWSEFHTSLDVLEPGDTLLLYTDGFIEEINPQGEQFGKERLSKCLIRHAALGIGELLKKIFEEIEAFGRPEGPADDRTLLLCRREAGIDGAPLP